MNKIIVLLVSLFFAIQAFADHIILNNQTDYPRTQNSKIAIQWANATQEILAGNHEIKMNDASIQNITQQGKINVDIPKDAKYLRILVWTNDHSQPNLMTNWVQVIANKIYPLQQDQLMPSELAAGMGC